jgi:hypothetical protein
MISDFLTLEWGRLKHGDEYIPFQLWLELKKLTSILQSREARVVFKAGKNCEAILTQRT